MSQGLARTPLYAAHLRLGGRMVEFGGFEMPVQYGSILEEHAAVRERVGVFDVSHMGQIHLEGPSAIADAERLVSSPMASLRVGRVRYGLLCNEDGGVVDDVTVYRLAENWLLLCVNASNIEKDQRWMVEHRSPTTLVHDRSADTGMLALQGPRAAEVMSALCGTGPAKLGRFRFDHFEAQGGDARGTRLLVSRTGYTGSDGFELFLDAGKSEALFEALLRAGEPFGLAPAGLGARDTLRLEAALPLYGHELDDSTSPLEAGLGRFVKRDVGGFIGADAIERRLQQGPTRALAGFVLTGPGVARANYEIAVEGKTVGRVTSGAPSPTLGKSIGLCYVPPSAAALGSHLEILIRKRAVAATVVETPFIGTDR